MQANSREVIELGAEALSLTRNALAMRYRFLDRALWKMELVETPLVSLIGTDTRKVYYNPTDVLRRFASSRDELARDVLHAIFHCLFYHPFVRSDIIQGAWDLSCDIVVEAACLELAGASFPCEGDAERTRAIGQLKTALGNLSAEKLYMHLTENELPYEELVVLDALFMRDDHGLWYAVKDGTSIAEQGQDAPAQQDDAVRLKGTADGQGNASPAPEAGDAPDEPDGQPGTVVEFEDADDDGDDANGTEPDGASSPAPAGEQLPATPPDEDAREDWEHIARRVKVELKNAVDEYGSDAGSLAAHLSIATRKRYDYRSFLRRFAEPREEMRLNPDEFDLIYYSFGMDTYGNVPLIEPLEYTESTKVRTFVIAIDTSGSVQGRLVERFIEETFSILQEASSFFDECRVHIVQCDARVQSDTVVTSREQLDSYLGDFELLGMGGTDFRPVFEHVNALVEAGEMEGLHGLIYFTDGRGTYPAMPPDYESVFVFVDEDYDTPPVPPWAYKLVIDEFQLRFLDRGA